MKTKKFLALILALLLVFSLAACGAGTDSGDSSADATASDTSADSTADAANTTDTQPTEDETPAEETEIMVFVAASLEGAFKDVITAYEAQNPGVTITYNADSSGKLMTQIQEGFECDLFFSAGKSQVDTLEEGGFLVDGTRTNLLSNQEVIISAKDSGTAVTGIDNITSATNIALAAESVPAGQYARKAMIAAGYLAPVDDVKTITTAQVSEALGVEINECSNVSAVKEAVKEGSCDIGFVYYSDAYSVIDYVDIIESLSSDLTGSIIYPAARVVNAAADDAQNAAADDFMAYLQTDEALQIFENYMFLVYEG